MINLADKLTAKTVEGILADSQEIKYTKEMGAAAKSETVASELSKITDSMAELSGDVVYHEATSETVKDIEETFAEIFRQNEAARQSNYNSKEAQRDAEFADKESQRDAATAIIQQEVETLNTLSGSVTHLSQDVDGLFEQQVSYVSTCFADCTDTHESKLRSISITTNQVPFKRIFSITIKIADNLTLQDHTAAYMYLKDSNGNTIGVSQNAVKQLFSKGKYVTWFFDSISNNSNSTITLELHNTNLVSDANDGNLIGIIAHTKQTGDAKDGGVTTFDGVYHQGWTTAIGINVVNISAIYPQIKELQKYRIAYTTSEFPDISSSAHKADINEIRINQNIMGISLISTVSLLVASDSSYSGQLYLKVYDTNNNLIATSNNSVNLSQNLGNYVTWYFTPFQLTNDTVYRFFAWNGSNATQAMRIHVANGKNEGVTCFDKYDSPHTDYCPALGINVDAIIANDLHKTIKEVNIALGNSISQINATLSEHRDEIDINKEAITNQGDALAAAILELKKSIPLTKAFIVETGPEPGYYYVDGVRIEIPANTRRSVSFTETFRMSNGDEGNLEENLITHVCTTFTDTSTLTSTKLMFADCQGLTSLDVSSFNTANVTDMYAMFVSCLGLTSLDVSSFNTANVTNMSGMFGMCAGLTSLDLSSFNTANVTDMSEMFNGCQGLTSLDVSSFNTANVTDMSGMFGMCAGLTSLDVSKFDTSQVTNMYFMFAWCVGLTSLDVSSFNTANVTNMYFMFADCQGLTSLNLSSFNTANVTNMSGMFGSCLGLTSLDLSSFNTANVTDMRYMFADCQGLTSLDLSSFNTANVTNMYAMFADCQGLTSLNLSSFNTANVTDMSEMFVSCLGLTSLDLSSFNTANVSNMVGMFGGCSGLSSLLLGPSFLKTPAVSSIDFSNCYNWTNETVVTSLVTNIYDRATYGLNTLTIKLHANTKAALTDEQKATITSKGYTIA